MMKLLLDGLRASNADFSAAGWGALLLTALVVLGTMALFPALRTLEPLTIVLGGTGLQLLFTLLLAGLRRRATG